MKKGYLILAAFLITAVLFLGGCGGGKAKDPETLVIAVSGGPRSLDPTLTNDSASSEIMVQIYDTLFTLNFDTLEPVPSLAERFAFENDADGNPTKLRLFLREGVKFHNGDEFTAKDVKFNLDRASASQHISHIAGEIQSTEIINDYEALVTLKSPFMPILNNLAHTALSIVNQRAVEELGDSYPQNPVGTGALKFVKWVVGNRIELTRWDEYWGEAPRIKNVTIRYIGDDATRMLELETGGVDIAYPIPPQDLSRVEANKEMQVFKRPSLSMSFIGFNNQKPPFNDLRVRQAIIHAIDMKALLDATLMGVGTVAKGPITSTVWASAADILPQLEYNPEKARQLLAQAGFPNGFTTTIATNENAQRIDTAVVMQNMLAQVGITVNISIMEWAAYLDMMDRGEQEIYILGWVTVTGDPDYGLEIFHSRSFGAGGNHSLYSNPEVDRLLDAARKEINSNTRHDMYIEAQKLIHADSPMLYSVEGESTIAARKNVRGFVINPAGHHPFWTVYFED